MKIYSFIVVGLVCSFFSGWLTDFDMAKKEAAEKNYLILLNFSGSDWCVPCIKQKKEIFETTEFKSFADSNLILLNADFPRSNKNKLDKQQVEKNEALAERYNPSGKFPFTLLLTANGAVLKEWEGMAGLTAADLIKQIKMISHASR